MKFTFITVVIYSSLHFAIAQYESSEFDSNTNSDDQPLSMNSCNNYWTIQRDNSGVWGQLSIPTSNRQQIMMKVFLSVSAVLPTEYVGELSLLKDAQSTINDISNGLPIIYRVKFPVQNPIPRLTGVDYNNQSLCSTRKGPKADGGIVTKITLSHTLLTGLTDQNSQNNKNIFTIPLTQPTTMTPIVHKLINEAPNTHNFLSIPDCGVPHYRLQDSTSLVVNGRAAVKGQFPWLAAYYHNTIYDSGFICGGSLISSKVVLTAAHCIHNKQDDVKKEEEALIYLGKYHLHSQSNERDFLVSGVTKFLMHPDWNTNSESYDGDIATIVLLRTIQFTNFIRPICIWTSTQNYFDIVNKEGVVAGYGKTESSIAASDKPFWAEIPVVDEGTCLRSNSIFRKITSKRTFCAGGQDGRGPCSGDSGSGFIMKSNQRWYLRGIVSSALFDKELYTCDTKNYAVFTDIAVFKDWILHQMEIYG